LRHVSPAFVEDPVRILRVARFAARFGFEVAPETMALMRSMVANGEADSLVPERTWQEFSRGLMEGDPGLMFPVLAQSALLAKLLPELKLEFEHGRPANDAARVLVRSLQCAAGERLGLAPRYALVASHAGSTANVSERLKAPGDCRDLALLAERFAGTIKRATALSAAELLELLERCDAFRRPDRFDDLLALTECLQRGERGWGDTPYMPRVVLRGVLGAAAGVDAGKIAARSAKDKIAASLRRARIAAIEALV